MEADIQKIMPHAWLLRVAFQLEGRKKGKSFTEPMGTYQDIGLLVACWPHSFFGLYNLVVVLSSVCSAGLVELFSPKGLE